MTKHKTVSIDRTDTDVWDVSRGIPAEPIVGQGERTVATEVAAGEVPEWKVKVHSGTAGGWGGEGQLQVQINCRAETVDEVRKRLESVPDLEKQVMNLTLALGHEVKERTGTLTGECEVCGGGLNGLAYSRHCCYASRKALGMDL